MRRATESILRSHRWLIATLLLAVLAIATAQQQNSPGGFLSNFVGEIEIVDSAEMRSSRIRFAAGARTNWHVHSERQLILIESGQGRLQEMGGPIIELQAGEPFYTQAKVPHWHGASPDREAVQFSVYSGTLDWQEPVTDAEYLGR